MERMKLFENMNIRCSGIKKIHGIRTFLVNYDYFDMKASKQCGIQLPQFQVCYNDGFDADELNILVEETAESMEELIDVALMMPTPEEEEEEEVSDYNLKLS